MSGYLYVLAAAALWGLIGPLSKLSFAAGMDTVEVAFWRTTLAWFLFAAQAVANRETHIDRRDLPAVAGFGVALAGCLGGLFLGVLLSRILVLVLNPQAFGWTLSYQVPYGFLGGLLLLCLVAAVAAMTPIARWASRHGADRQAEEGAS